MGTHPIFESDFDCLTDKMTNVVFDGLLTKCRELFSDKVSDRKCPECEKKGTNSPRWEPWMGSLKDHLLEHYRAAYFLDRKKTDDKFKKSKHCPWSDDYETVPREKLEQYMDKDIFHTYFTMKKRREEEARELQARKERKMLLVEKERERRRLEFEEKLKENKTIFS